MKLTDAQRKVLMACVAEMDFCYPLTDGNVARTLYALQEKGLMKPAAHGFGHQNLYELTELGKERRKAIGR